MPLDSTGLMWKGLHETFVGLNPSLCAHVAASCGEGCRTGLSYLLSLDLSFHRSEDFGQLTSSQLAVK